MSAQNPIRIFLVDDNALYLAALELEFLAQGRYTVEIFATGELCIAGLSLGPDIIILDYHLDGIDKTAMNGIATLDKIRESHPETPVIMLSSQDKIDVAVNCMHHKAFDYVVKNETAFMRLEKAIDTALRYQKMEKELNWYMERM